MPIKCLTDYSALNEILDVHRCLVGLPGSRSMLRDLAFLLEMTRG